MDIKLDTQTKFKVVIENADNLKPDELEKLKRSVKIWETVWRSPEFKQFCLNFKWEKTVKTGGIFRRRYEKKMGDFFRMTSLNRVDVYRAIMNGKEQDDKAPDYSYELSIKLDRKNVKGVLGYSYYKSIWQYTYANFFHKSDEYELAGHLAHEACHRLGFSHEFKYNSLREFTVPYAVGYFTREQGKLLNIFT